MTQTDADMRATKCLHGLLNKAALHAKTCDMGGDEMAKNLFRRLERLEADYTGNRGGYPRNMCAWAH